jgi:hypothetical protein
MCPRRWRIVFAAALCALALPAASARAADPVIVSQRILTGPIVLNGNLVYRQGTKPGVCMRRVGGRLSRATRLPLPDCGAGGMNLDSHGRVISVDTDHLIHVHPATSGTLSVHVDPLLRRGSELKFGVYTGTSLGTLTPVGGPSSPPASIQFDAVAGQQYWIDVGTSDAQAKYMPLDVSVTPP